MGIGGISVGSLLIVLAIVVLLFGTKRLRSLGSDLGSAFKGFREAVTEGESAKRDATEQLDQSGPATQESTTKAADRKAS